MSPLAGAIVDAVGKSVSVFGEPELIGQYALAFDPPSLASIEFHAAGEAAGAGTAVLPRYFLTSGQVESESLPNASSPFIVLMIL
jgi:hypothetical protein